MAEKKAVAKRPQNAVAVSSARFEAHASAGLENVTTRDLLIPRLTILQSNSPQVLKAKPEYIKDAKPGDICDVGTMEIFEAPLAVLPVHFVKQWLEWAPRNSGKGLVMIHDSDEIMDKTEKDDKNKAVLANGNYIAETAQFFVLNLAARGRPCFIPMTSTQLKKSRRWLTWATGERAIGENGGEFVPPLFYRTYLLSTVPESNNDGDWFGWQIERSKLLDEVEGNETLFQAAVTFRDSIARGEARGDVSSLDTEEKATATKGDRF